MFTLGLNEELPSVKGDRYQLEQLFINLLMNAFQSIESKLAAATVKTAAIQSWLNTRGP